MHATGDRKREETKTLDELGHPVGSGAWGLCMGFPFLAFLATKQRANKKKSASTMILERRTQPHMPSVFGWLFRQAPRKLQLARRKWDKLNLKNSVHPVCCWSKGNERTTWVPFDDLPCKTLSLASPPQGRALPQAGFQVRNHSSIRTEDGGETYRLPSFPTWQGLAFLNDKRFIV